jgi:hypothetical protein
LNKNNRQGRNDSGHSVLLEHIIHFLIEFLVQRRVGGCSTLCFGVVVFFGNERRLKFIFVVFLVFVVFFGIDVDILTKETINVNRFYY